MPLPRPLTPDSRVAVAAPASAALDARDTEAGLAALRAEGLRIEAAHATEPVGYLAGTDAARADALNALLRRDDLDAVVCLRGGYGLLRILDRIDVDAARAHPKLIVGYSDVTALHLALYAEAGLPGLSGPMVASDWSKGLDPEVVADFWRVAGGASGYAVRGPGGERLVPMQAGEAEGVLLGGNLALTAALLGTPYLPDLDGAILFLEDVGEPPYRIDGLLARLRLAGVLGRLGGLVFGMFTGAEVPKGRPTLSVDEVLRHYAPFVGGPVASGLVYGHVARKNTLPVGVRAHLAVGAEAELTVLEPVAR
ncbi:MAG: LD-carboxypeptidase [Bacteroidota bacterium]